VTGRRQHVHQPVEIRVAHQEIDVVENAPAGIRVVEVRTGDALQHPDLEIVRLDQLEHLHEGRLDLDRGGRRRQLEVGDVVNLLVGEPDGAILVRGRKQTGKAVV
jgi:hypothetical protein